MRFESPPAILPAQYYGKNTPAIRLVKGKDLSINKAALKCLGNPQNIVFWYSKARNTLVMGGAETPTDCSFSVPEYCYRPKWQMKIRKSAFINMLMRCGGWSENKTYAVNGEMNAALGTVDFCLNSATIEEVFENE